MTRERVRRAPRRPILWIWGALAMLFVGCAYAMALGLAGLCAFLSVAVLASFSLGALIVFLGAGTCAAVILWSLVPRRDKFIPPGAELTAASQPRLFAEISQIAAAFDEPMPAAVYLMLDPNAWVARRVGRRVMAIGLPLLSVLTVSEFRAILAHEFAHYYGGDTGLGPWIQRAREALARSLEKLSADWGFLNVLRRWAVIALLRFVIILVFSTYWKVFLWLTLLVSRQWEYRADELACAAVGAKPLMEGLRKVEMASCAWPSFWQSDAQTPLLAGFGPPLAEGFERYMRAPGIVKPLEALVAPRLQKEKADASDTHPTFHQRGQRAFSYPYESVPLDDAPALTLFDAEQRLELSSIQVLKPDGQPLEVKPIEWEQVGPLVMIPNWTGYVGEYRELLDTYTIGDLPAAVAALGALGPRIRDPQGRLLTRDQRVERAAALLWMSMALALIADGWQLKSDPGDVCLVRGERKVVPMQLVARLRQGDLSATEYRDLVSEIGATALPLAPS